MGSGLKKRVEIARLEAELSTVRREQRLVTARTDPRWRRAAWALVAWAFVGPIAGLVLGLLLR